MGNNNDLTSIPPEYKPISMWGYFGYELLFSIPFIGFIVLIVFAISARNINLRNFARSYFCFLIIFLIIIGIAIGVGAGSGLISQYVNM